MTTPARSGKLPVMNEVTSHSAHNDCKFVLTIARASNAMFVNPVGKAVRSMKQTLPYPSRPQQLCGTRKEQGSTTKLEGRSAVSELLPVVFTFCASRFAFVRINIFIAAGECGWQFSLAQTDSGIKRKLCYKRTLSRIPLSFGNLIDCLLTLLSSTASYRIRTHIDFPVVRLLDLPRQVVWHIQVTQTRYHSTPFIRSRSPCLHDDESMTSC